MKKSLLLFSTIIFLNSYSFVQAEQQFHFKKGYITIPNSSIAKPYDKGLRMHTNYKIYSSSLRTLASNTPQGETPASMACIYGLTTLVPGCPISHTSALPGGGWGAIALVDAYDNPFAEADLAVFSAQFGLPACTTSNGCFSKVYANGTQPAFDPDWAIEEALDIEWAHAMAPNAKIILVEAASNSNADLFAAEAVASQAVLINGGGQVSNSWGGSEYLGESAYDSYFQVPGIVYFASSGDSAAPANYPASSPYVVSAGGTTVIRNGGMFIGETAWSYDARLGWGSSGGPSVFEARPIFQTLVQRIVGSARGTPDISFNANPFSGVSVYVTSQGGWLVVGGTSVSSPSLAGIINVANHKAASTSQELNYIYKNAIKNYHAYWHDIVVGNNGYPSLAGYDFVTGLGSPLGYGGK